MNLSVLLKLHFFLFALSLYFSLLAQSPITSKPRFTHSQYGQEAIFNSSPFNQNCMIWWEHIWQRSHLCQALNHAKKTAVRIRGRDRRTWDGIGLGQASGHLFFYNRKHPIPDSITAYYNWNLNYTLNPDSLRSGTPGAPADVGRCLHRRE